MSAHTARDEDGNFLGHQPRECGEHRTVGEHRAWCFDCQEWCRANRSYMTAYSPRSARTKPQVRGGVQQ